MTQETYSEAVAPLLTKEYRHSYKPEDWPDYLAEFSFTDAHVPELCRMVIDPHFDELDQDDPAVWAPLHALRALGQLRNPSAIAPLITLFSNELDDYMSETLPVVLGMIGGAAIAPLEDALQNESIPEWSRVRIIGSFEEIAKAHPGDCPACVAVLTQHLEHYATNTEVINSTLVDTLAELQATEAAPLIETVFSEADLDEMTTGSWPSVQVRLGLKQESDFTPEELQPAIPEYFQNIQESLGEFKRQFAQRQSQKPKGFGDSTPKSSKKKSKKKKK